MQTVFDSNYRHGALSVDLSMENESSQEVSGAALMFLLKDPQGHGVSLADDHLPVTLAPWSRLEKVVEFQVAAPQHWEAEHPVLYTLSAKLSGANGDEVVSRRFGFRQVEIRGSQFLINGVAVKLRGVNHYESDPLGGRSIEPELTRRDLQGMKEDNLDCHPHLHLPCCSGSLRRFRRDGILYRRGRPVLLG